MSRGRTGGGWRKAGIAALALALSGMLAAPLWLGGGPEAPRDRALPDWSAGGTPRRIVAFGTSLTAGNGWPDRLAKGLVACFGHPVELRRVAGPGMGSAWALDQVDRVAALEPDLVLIEFAINDADLRDGVSRATGRAQHGRLIDSLQAALPEATLALMTMSPASGLRGLARPRLGGHYADVVALAETRDLPLIDLYPRWRASGRSPPADGLHPDDAATRAVIDPAMEAVFGAATGRGCPI